MEEEANEESFPTEDGDDNEEDAAHPCSLQAIPNPFGDIVCDFS
jgi:hypothetical protein